MLAAGLCFPALALFFVAKPNIGGALLVAAGSRRSWIFAAIGGACLLAISLVLLPSWPPTWLRNARTSVYSDFPIAQWGGPVVLLALLRWRRPEARLIVALACVPQTVYWYDGLYLLFIPRTFLESLLLSLMSSVGFLVERTLVGWQPDVPYKYAGELIIAFLYLPATFLVLRRPNEGELPPWLRLKRGASAIESQSPI